jgi:hypothetical protein
LGFDLHDICLEARKYGLSPVDCIYSNVHFTIWRGWEMKSGGNKNRFPGRILGVRATAISTHHNAPTIKTKIAPTDRSSGKQLADNFNALKFDYCLRLTINQCNLVMRHCIILENAAEIDVL